MFARSGRAPSVTGLRAAAAAAVAAAAVLAAALSLGGGTPTAGAQEAGGCEVTDLGTLGTDASSELRASGRWSTEDCDSRFLPDADAHTYRFELAEGGEIRIDLTSPDGGDSYLHLLDADGGPVVHDDDGGFALDARIESRLEAGVYQVEAAQGSGRARGPAGFELSIVRTAGCEAVDLGALTPGEGLTVEDAWSFEDCSARFRRDSPARIYRFDLPAPGLVRIDLATPEESDAFLYLLTSDGRYLYEDDDGGADRNSRIENELTAGSYLVEATTYVDREHGHALTEFTLSIRLVSPDAYRIKTEAIRLPDRLIAGQPFAVDYRVGNLGQSDLPPDHLVLVVAATPGDFARARPSPSGGGRWAAGVSYHSSALAAGATSVPLAGLAPMELTVEEPGPSWVVLAVAVYDGMDREVSFHRLEVEVLAFSALPFAPVRVAVGGAHYAVSAAADEEGLVTTTVIAVADPAAEVAAAERARAIYAAGVLTELLDGITGRPALAALQAAADPAPFGVPLPTSGAVTPAFADLYLGGLAASGLQEALASGQVVNPLDVEELTIRAAATASAQHASAQASWRELLARIAAGEPLSFEEALSVHAGLSYAERVLAPLAHAGAAVEAARAAEAGWADPGARAHAARLASAASCAGVRALGSALAAAGAGDIDGVLALERELRAALPIHGLAVDAALCGAARVDLDTGRFLASLALGRSAEIARVLAPDAPAPEPPPPPPPPERLRVVARLAADGRVEHGVELASGAVVLPVRRFLPVDARAGEWRITSEIAVGEASLGTVRARRLADGRIELGFRTAVGEAIAPDVRYLPAALPAGVWLRSGEIEVPLPLRDGEGE